MGQINGHSDSDSGSVMILHVVAGSDVEFARGVTDNVKERHLGNVAKTVVPPPDIAQYEVDGGLIVAVTLGVVGVTVYSVKLAAQWYVVSDAAFLACAHPEPPYDVAEDLSGIWIYTCMHASIQYIVHTY